MKKRIFAIVLLVALASATAYFLFWRGNGNSQRILVTGNIELTEVNIGFKTSGRLVECAVDEGDPVTKGMVVARLDREQLNPQLERDQAGLTAAESQLAELRTAIEYQGETLEARIQAGQADLDQAKSRLRELLAGSRPQEIEEAQAAVQAALADSGRARNDWERAQTLHKNDDISTAQYDQFRTQFARATAALKQARERAALVVEGPRKEDIDAARARVAGAQAALRLAEAERLELKRKQQELATRRAGIKQSLAQTSLTESQLRDRDAISPIDGVVLVKAAEVGEVLAAGTTVVTVGDIEHPWLRGYVTETDLGRVKLGARVKVTTDSFPGKVYWGRVSFIASEAEFTPKQIQTPEERVKLVYRVKVEIPNPNQELKSNMPADAEIILGEAK